MKIMIDIEYLKLLGVEYPSDMKQKEKEELAKILREYIK